MTNTTKPNPLSAFQVVVALHVRHSVHVILYAVITVLAVVGAKWVYESGYKAGWLDSFHQHEKHIIWPEPKENDYK